MKSSLFLFSLLFLVSCASSSPKKCEDSCSVKKECKSHKVKCSKNHHKMPDKLEHHREHGFHR